MKFVSFKNIAIVGMGFMGTSLALAIKKHCLSDIIVGYDTDKDRLIKAKAIGAIDNSADTLQEVCPDKDLVILAAPVDKIIEILPFVAEYIPQGCIVTDLGSVKDVIVAKADECFSGNKYFVGSHPMRGSAKSGPDYANKDIIDGACCYVTIGDKTNYEAASKVVLFWKSLGANPLIIRPKRHDYLTAATSHLPHLSSVALTLTVNSLLNEDMNFINKIVGNGFKWATKTAESPSYIWTGITKNNKENILDALNKFKDEIELLIKYIKDDNFEQLKEKLDKARDFRSDFKE